MLLFLKALYVCGMVCFLFKKSCFFYFAGCWKALRLPILFVALTGSLAGAVALAYLWTSSGEAPFDVSPKLFALCLDCMLIVAKVGDYQDPFTVKWTVIFKKIYFKI